MNNTFKLGTSIVQLVPFYRRQSEQQQQKEIRDTIQDSVLLAKLKKSVQ
ncbi:MAG TPA: hypothetical protein VIP29_00710 [Nitrososphaeraceae archaeon]